MKRSKAEELASSVAYRTTSVQVLRHIARYFYNGSPYYGEGVMERVAANRATPSDVLLKCAMHHNVSVRVRVAKNHNADEETLTVLSNDYDREVIESLAGNPSTPTCVLQRLWRTDPFLSLRALETLSQKDGFITGGLLK